MPDDARLVPRHAYGLVEEALTDSPVVVLQGARQVGKSTLARQILADRPGAALSLDDTAVLAAATADPDGFVRQGNGLLVIDEVQRAPELLRALKSAVDEDRRPGRFLVTGSADLLSLPGAQESLAGRAETVALHGLSQAELHRRPGLVDALLAGEPRALRAPEALTRVDYMEIVCAGSYPEALHRQGRRRAAWFDNYLARVLSRDAAEVSELQHLERLPVVLSLLAANNAGELVRSRLAEASGVPASSLDAYLRVQVALQLVQVLPAWGRNLTSRVIDRPKVALLDSGVAARLAGVSAASLAGPASDVAGGLTEAFVAGELRRQLALAESAPSLHHFRDRNGLEVDLLLADDAGRVAGIEVKAALTVRGSDFRGLAGLRDRLGERFRSGVLLYTGDRVLPFGDRLTALPLSALWAAAA
jgi:predicted AAA+ superfamily ATPase